MSETNECPPPPNKDRVWEHMYRMYMKQISWSQNCFELSAHTESSDLISKTIKTFILCDTLS
jgi:hypothetical protein